MPAFVRRVCAARVQTSNWKYLWGQDFGRCHVYQVYFSIFLWNIYMKYILVKTMKYIHANFFKIGMCTGTCTYTQCFEFFSVCLLYMQIPSLRTCWCLGSLSASVWYQPITFSLEEVRDISSFSLCSFLCSSFSWLSPWTPWASSPDSVHTKLLCARKILECCSPRGRRRKVCDPSSFLPQDRCFWW